MKTTRLNEDIDRAVREVCDIRPDCTKMQFRIRIFMDQKRTSDLDGFNRLATLFERLEESGRVGVD